MGPAVMQRGLKVPQDLLLLGQAPELGEGRAAVHFKGTCRATPCRWTGAKEGALLDSQCQGLQQSCQWPREAVGMSMGTSRWKVARRCETG